MLLTSVLEPIFYHPIILFSTIRGNFKFFSGEKTWGKMERQGFSENENQDKEVKEVEGNPPESLAS